MVLACLVLVFSLHRGLVLYGIDDVRYHESILIVGGIGTGILFAEDRGVAKRIMHHRDDVQLLVCCIHQGVDEPVDLLLREYSRHERVCVTELAIVVVEGVKENQTERTHDFVRLDVYVSISPMLFGIAPNRLLEVLHCGAHTVEVVGIGDARHIVVPFEVDVWCAMDIGCLDDA